jgi:hypothetical protein
MANLQWFWIVLELTVTPIVALLVAFPFWRKGGMIFGNIAGTVIIFGSAFALIMREYVEIDRMVQECLDAGDVCFPFRARLPVLQSMPLSVSSKCSRYSR